MKFDHCSKQNMVWTLFITEAHQVVSFRMFYTFVVQRFHFVCPDALHGAEQPKCLMTVNRELAELTREVGRANTACLKTNSGLRQQPAMTMMRRGC